MDLLFRKGYPMPELRKLQVSTATTVSAKIYLFSLCGWYYPVFPIQTGQQAGLLQRFCHVCINYTTKSKVEI